MTSPAPSPLRQLATRKAWMTRYYGADDPRTVEASGALKLALLAKKIQDAKPLTNAERDELIALLLAA